METSDKKAGKKSGKADTAALLAEVSGAAGQGGAGRKRKRQASANPDVNPDGMEYPAEEKEAMARRKPRAKAYIQPSPPRKNGCQRLPRSA